MNLWNSTRTFITVPENVELPGPIELSGRDDECPAPPDEMLATAAAVHDLTVMLQATGDPQYAEAITTGIYWEAALIACAVLCTAI